MAAEKTAGKQRGRSFRPGKSGNPAGRPRGARNKTTLAVEALLDGEAETITRKAIELAKTGDRVRLHGGASGSGGPPGERNGQNRHGERTKAAIAEQRKFSALLKMLRAGLT